VNDAALCLAVLGLFAAGIVKGATGVGYSSCALPFLVSAVGLQPAMGLVIVPALASNVMLLFTAGHVRETALRFWPLYAATLPGIAAGIALLVWIDQAIPTCVLGILIVLYAVLALARPKLHLAQTFERPALVPVGLVNGLFTGLTGSQVMPLMPFMLAIRLDTDRFVQANNLAVITASIFLALGLMTAGVMSVPTLAWSLGAVVPAIFGVQLGNWARQYIPAEQFRLLVLVLLIGLGLSLALRGLIH